MLATILALLAAGVLASIIGHQQEKNWVITDAGWMAMSRDRGTANHAVDQGYGVVNDVADNTIVDYIVSHRSVEKISVCSIFTCSSATNFT